MTKVQILGGIMFFTGLRPVAFAEKYGISPSTIYAVARGEVKTKYVRKLIADTLGKSVDEVFQDQHPEKIAA